MVAIISKQIRVNNAGNFRDDIGTNSTYLYIGRSQQWPSSDTAIATPVDTVFDKNNVHQNMNKANVVHKDERSKNYFYLDL